MIRSMKDSKIEWIGEIPESWDVVAIQRNFDEIKEINENMQCVIPLQYKYGKIIRKQENNCSEQKSIYTKYLLVKANDIMINGLNLSFDFITQRVARVEEDGIITSTYIALRPKATVDSRYATFLFKSYDGCKALHSMGRGLRSILSFNEFKKYNMPYPPLAEQKKIADFLDGKCAEIDELVQTEEKMIEELKAYKQSVITEAVTKGLDPTALMKDSGIEWIGEIPITWDVRRAKQLFATLSGNGLSTDLQVDDGIPFYKAGDISTCDKFLEVAKSCVESNIAEERNFNIIPATSIVFAKIGEAMKKNSRAITTIECCIDNNCQALIPKRVDCIFAYYLMLCIDMRWFDNAGTLPCVSVYKLMQSSMPYPHPDEQKQIADYLDEKCAKIDEIIALRTEQINQLKEYKKSLIYEYVTGKKEVV